MADDLVSTSRKRNGGHFCGAIGCNNSRYKASCKGKPFFTFPKDKARCRIWIQNIRRDDLQGLSAEEVRKKGVHICNEHFEENQFNVPSEKKRLVWNAVPTIFKVPNPPPRLTLKRKGRPEPLDKSCRMLVKKPRLITSEIQFDVNLPAKIDTVIEEGPVPQMLFINEAFYHSKSKSPVSSETFKVKQEDEEQYSQHSCLGIKTKGHTLDYGLCNQIYDTVSKLKRETERNMSCECDKFKSSQYENIESNNSCRLISESELQATASYFISDDIENIAIREKNTEEDAISTTDFNEIKLEHEQIDMDLDSSLANCPIMVENNSAIKTNIDLHQAIVTVEKDEKVNTPFTNDSLTINEDLPSSEFFPCKQIKPQNSIKTVRLNFEERKFILKCYWKYENTVEVQRQFRRKFKKEPPTRLTINQIRDIFEVDGTVENNEPYKGIKSTGNLSATMTALQNMMDSR